MWLKSGGISLGAFHASSDAKAWPEVARFLREREERAAAEVAERVWNSAGNGILMLNILPKSVREGIRFLHAYSFSLELCVSFLRTIHLSIFQVSLNMLCPSRAKLVAKGPMGRFHVGFVLANNFASSKFLSHPQTTSGLHSSFRKAEQHRTAGGAPKCRNRVTRSAIVTHK